MANITLKDLSVSNITGVDLFHDSESFMRDLSDDEVGILGGVAAQTTLVPRLEPAINNYVALTHAIDVAFSNGLFF